MGCAGARGSGGISDQDCGGRTAPELVGTSTGSTSRAEDIDCFVGCAGDSSTKRLSDLWRSRLGIARGEDGRWMEIPSELKERFLLLEMKADVSLPVASLASSIFILPVPVLVADKKLFGG